MSKIKVGIVLAIEEPYSPKEGGALATWVNSVYPYVVDFEPLIFSTKTKTPYPFGKIFYLPSIFFIWLSRFFLGKMRIFLKDNLYPFIVAKICKSKGILLIHIHNRPLFAYIIKKAHPKAKVVLHMQNDHMVTIADNLFIKAVHSIDGLISTSNYIQNGINNRLKKHGLTISSQTVIYNGADEIEIHNTRKKSGKIRLLFVGRFVKEKGVLEYVKAFNALAGKYSELELDIVGGAHFNNSNSTPYIQLVQEEAQKYKERIHFVGPVPHTELYKYFERASIYAVPSIWDDPFPLTVIEGLAAKLPVISTNRGGIPEALSGGAGIILNNPEDIEEFSDAIEQLILNPERSLALAENGFQKFSNNFRWVILANNLQTYFKTLI